MAINRRDFLKYSGAAVAALHMGAYPNWAFGQVNSGGSNPADPLGPIRPESVFIEQFIKLYHGGDAKEIRRQGSFWQNPQGEGVGSSGLDIRLNALGESIPVQVPADQVVVTQAKDTSIQSTSPKKPLEIVSAQMPVADIAKAYASSKPAIVYDKANNKLIIPVITDLTGLEAMNYVLAGMTDAPPVTTAFARKVLSVSMGAKSPKVIYTGTKSDEVVHHGQLIMRTKPLPEFYKNQAVVVRGPGLIDYIFPGKDTLVMDLEKVPSQVREFLMNKYCIGQELTKSELNVVMGKKFARTIDEYISSAQKWQFASAEDREAVLGNLEKMAANDPSALIARMVTKNTGVMYAGLAAKGVTFHDAKDYKGVVGGAKMSTNHRGDATLQYLIAFAAELKEPMEFAGTGQMWKKVNFGATEYRPEWGNFYRLVVNMDEEGLTNQVGASVMREINRKEQPAPRMGKPGENVRPYFGTVFSNQPHSVSELEKYRPLFSNTSVVDIRQEDVQNALKLPNGSYMRPMDLFNKLKSPMNVCELGIQKVAYK